MIWIIYSDFIDRAKHWQALLLTVKSRLWQLRRVMLMPSSFESPDSRLFSERPHVRRLILGMSEPSRIRDWNNSTYSR